MKKSIYIITTAVAIFIGCSSYGQDKKFNSKQFYTEFVEPLDGINSEDAYGIIEDASTMNRLRIELETTITYIKEHGISFPSKTNLLLVDGHFIKEFSDIIERVEIRKDDMPKQYYNKMMNELKDCIKKAQWLRAEYVKAMN